MQGLLCKAQSCWAVVAELTSPPGSAGCCVLRSTRRGSDADGSGVPARLQELRGRQRLKEALWQVADGEA